MAKNRKRWFQGLGWKSEISPAVLLIVLAVWVTAIFLAYQIFDRRPFVDHDIYYNWCFFNKLKPAIPVETFSSLFSCLKSQNMAYFSLPFLMLSLSKLVDFGPALFRLFNLPFFLSLFFGVYFLGKKIGGKRLGLACAFLAATLPILENESRKFDPQFHAAAVAIWIHVIAIDIHRRAGAPSTSLSMLLGLVWGTASLFHPIALFYGTPVAVWMVWPMVVGFRRVARDRSSWLPILGMALTLLVAMAPILWLLPDYFSRNETWFSSPLEGGGRGHDPVAFLRELSAFFGVYMSLLVAATMLVAVPATVVARLRRLYYPAIASTFFLGASYVTWTNDAILSDFVLLYVFISVWGLASIHAALRLFQRRLDRRRAAVAWTLAAIILVSVGFLEKNESFTVHRGGRVYTVPQRGEIEYNHASDRRVVVLDVPPLRRIIQAITRITVRQRTEVRVRPIKIDGNDLPFFGGSWRDSPCRLDLAGIRITSGLFETQVFMVDSRQQEAEKETVELSFFETDSLPIENRLRVQAKFVSRLRKDPLSKQVLWLNFEPLVEEDPLFSECLQSVVLRTFRR